MQPYLIHFHFPFKLLISLNLFYQETSIHVAAVLAPFPPCFASCQRPLSFPCFLLIGYPKEVAPFSFAFIITLLAHRTLKFAWRKTIYGRRFRSIGISLVDKCQWLLAWNWWLDLGTNDSVWVIFQRSVPLNLTQKKTVSALELHQVIKS